MATTLSPAIAEELGARLRDVCAQAGIDPGGARLVKYTMNAVFVAPPFVLRLAQGPHAATLADRVVAVAVALERTGAPTIRLARSLCPQPVRADDWAATIWHQVTIVDDEPKPVDLAAPLRAMHALGELGVPLPAWSPVEKFRRRLDTTEILPDREFAELRQWSRAELNLDVDDLLRQLRRRCDEADAELAQVTWHLPAGLIHGDAHTGNTLLRTAPRRPEPDPSALLCDLDGVCHGPREWDLVPTAHGTTRFARPTADYRAFADAYGFDITAWSGWPTLRRVRELQLVTSTINALTGRADVAAQLAHRLRSLLADDPDVIWARYH